VTAPRIPIWSRVAFLVLLPFVLYSAWGYIESRRLQSRVDVIQQRGEPLQRPYPRLTSENRQAERLYRAAAALQVAKEHSIEARNNIERGWRENRWTPDTIALVRGEVLANREALEFVDRASALPFAGFAPGTAYNYRAGDLMNLGRLLELRAAVEIGEQRFDAALASFYSEARLVRAVDALQFGIDGGMAGRSVPMFTGLSAAVSAVGRAAGRERLAQAFADVDVDDRLRADFMGRRVSLLNSFVDGSLARYPANPFVAHITVRQLDAFAEIIAAAKAPWPQRIEAITAVGRWPLGFGSANAVESAALRSYTKSIAEQVQRIRCARLIASPQPLVLVDPFTGKPLEVGNCPL
jgi:hypothetical protein